LKNVAILRSSEVSMSRGVRPGVWASWLPATHAKIHSEMS